MHLGLRGGLRRGRVPVVAAATLLLAAFVVPVVVQADASPPPEGSFTIVVLPDTQYYCSDGDPAVNAIFAVQTQWIVDHEESHNIGFVLHEGDVVNGDGLDLDQWNIARAAMGSLDGRVPYVIAPGNHDYEGNAVTRFTHFNDDRYFGPNSPYATQQTVGGFFEDNRTDNSYHVFRAGEADWLVVALQFGPSDDVVDWASGVVAAHPNHSVIVLTHAYMYADDTRYDWVKRGGSQGGNPYSYRIATSRGETVNDGQQLWDKLVKIHPNVRLVLSGHVTGRGVGLLTSIGDHGQVVHEMLANYQTGVHGSTHGGNGFMRLIDISADGKMNVRTYSPQVDEFKTTPIQEFTLEIAPNKTGEIPRSLVHQLDGAEASIEALEDGGFYLGKIMEDAVERHDMAKILAEKGYFHTAEWILDVKVVPVLEQLGDVPALLSEATASIGDAKVNGIDNLTLGSLEDCLASARECLNDSDVDGARSYLERVMDTSLWQGTPAMLALAREVIEELEEAGDRRVFMARGDYDRATKALSKCDHGTAQTYLTKVIAIPEPATASIVVFCLISVLWHGPRERRVHRGTLATNSGVSGSGPFPDQSR